MSKVAIVGDVQGTGVLTLKAPNTNVDKTLELPANSTKLVGDEGADFQTMPSVNGTPIVESGSNSDGEWTKWADGTMYCAATVTQSIAVISASANIYIGVMTGRPAFPMAFIDTPASVSHQFESPDSNLLWAASWTGSQSNYASWPRVYACSNASRSEAVLTIKLQAKGRWK